MTPWLFIEHGAQKTWVRAFIPDWIKTVADLVGYLKHGGQVDAYKLDLPDHPRYSTRIAGFTVIANVSESR